MIVLREPNLKFISSYLDFMSEMKEHGEPTWNIPNPEETNEQFVLRMRNSKIFPEPGKVLESKFWVEKCLDLFCRPKNASLSAKFY